MPNGPSSILVRVAILALASAAPLFTAGCVAAAPESDEAADQGGEVAYEDPESSESAVTDGTVLQAMQSSCTTASVKPLSQQIIDEVRCMNPDAYVLVPNRANVTFGSAVFRYLEKPARDKLVAALDANPGTSLTVNSMLRTVAQQYLLYSWYQSGRCGIGLAAKPGNSNHETGLALDVSEYSTWKSILQNRGFSWLGSGDPVHFDYAGTGAVSHKGLDIKAFQRLWNRNNANDQITADGVWGPQTEGRMKKAPAAGFAIGAQCGSAAPDGAQKAGAPETEAEQMSADDESLRGVPVGEIDPAEHEDESCSDHAL